MLWIGAIHAGGCEPVLDQSHGGGFPIARFSRVQTVGIDEMHAQFSRLVRPHDVNLTDRRADFISEIRYAALSRTVLSSTLVGASMKVKARPDSEAYLVFGAVNTPINITIGARRTVIPHGAVDVVPPDTPFELDIPHANVGSLMLEIEQSYLEAMLAEETGQEVSRPLRFAEASPRYGPSERSFLAVLEFAKDELASGVSRCGRQTYMHHLEELMVSALLHTLPHNYSQRLRDRGEIAEPRYVRRAGDYMHAHAAEDLNLKSIASLVAVSPRTLVRGFRKYRDCSPAIYLRNVRLDRCRRDLLDACPEDVSVTAIATKWGFSNMGRFARFYRMRYGENPIDTLKRIP